MLKLLIRRRIDRFARQYDYDTSYMSELLETSQRAFLRFARVAGLSRHRESLPPAPWYAAKLAATLHEDCGPCTQLVVRMAAEDGVPPATLAAIVGGDESRMDEEVRLGWRFAQAVLAHDPAADGFREEIVRRWGDKAVVSLALGIAASRMFPTIKVAMGHGRACQRVRVGDRELVPASRHAAAQAGFAQ